MAIQSSISELGLIDLFQILSLQKKTGYLIISDGPGGEEARVLFSEGSVGFASTYDRVPKTTISLLLEWGAVDQESLRRVESTLGNYSNLAACLDGEGVVSESYLKKLVSARTQDVIYELFKWCTGTCRFTEVASFDETMVIIVPLNTENLILEGARRIDEWENITSKVPSPHSVFRICSAGDGEQHLNLNPKEWEILSLIDGKCSVREAAEAVSCDVFTTSKLIYGLVVMNVIELVDGEKKVNAEEGNENDNVESLLERGRRYYKRGRLEKAASEYEKAIQLDVCSFDAMRMLGEIYYKLGRLSEAAVYLEKIRKARPGNEKAIFISGQLHARLGEIDLAVKEWNELRERTSNQKIADILKKNVAVAKKWKKVLQRY